MESRNLDRALDIVSKLINGENVGENGDMQHCIRSTAQMHRFMTLL